ncbi:MAG TPA: phosphoribosyltransferase family protein [Bacteroidales bacterium]|mgnify:CR=1 FL=1|nr:phosphoribosyltransferase family protein [Bacteroidales bacterium]HPS70950.1 phosphoribosyltransferase family protein [Bacteroidales bacterium]
MKKISQILENLLSFFYPKLCISCGNALRQHETFFCLGCLQNLPETEFHKIDYNPLIYNFMGRVRVENVFSFLFYRKGNCVQDILHEIKYKGGKELAEYLGYLYGVDLIQCNHLEDIELIIPIPLHKRKEKKRGYNQSEWIAKGLSRAFNKPYSNEILIRKDYTETQTKKGRFKRWENVKNVFEVTHQDAIKNKHILLCDDVLTTGATLEAAIAQFVNIEGVKVSVVTLAAAM